MRKLFMCTLLLMLGGDAFCQQTNPSQPLTKNDYLQKSKNQKTAAWVLLGGGLAVAVGGAALDVSSDWSNSETPYLIAITAGCASMLGSIPLFISSARNKRKAMSAATYFEIRQQPILSNTGMAFQAAPTLSLKLTF